MQHPGQLDVVDVRPMPRTNRGSSLRSIRPCPTGFWSLSACSRSSRASVGGHDALPTVVGRPPARRRARAPAAASRVLGRPLDRAHDGGVAGAAADLAGDGLADRLLAGVGVAVEQRPGGHHHPGRAEAALQAVAAHEALLDRVEDAVLLEVLDGAHLVAAGHRGQHRAGLDRLAVHPGHAGAAVAGVAAPVGAGEPELVAQEVHEQQPALDLAGDALAVDGHRHLHVSRSSLVVVALVARDAGPDPLDRAPQRAPGELVGEVALVVGGAAVVGDRRAALGGDRPGLGVELLGRAPGRAAPRRSPGCRWCSGPTAASPTRASVIDRRRPSTPRRRPRRPPSHRPGARPWRRRSSRAAGPGCGPR